MTATARLVATYMDRQVAALEAALKTPGQAVAIVQPVALLSENGVLDRLRRKGFEVTLPNVD